MTVQASPDQILEELRKRQLELETHQHELEVQNEELSTAREVLEHTRDEYRELYDAAPIGYLTLGPTAEIRAANVTACLMLRTEHSRLLAATLYDFIRRDQREVLFLHLRDVFANHRAHSCELALHPPGLQHPRYVQLKSINRGTEESMCALVTLSDITEQEELKQKLRENERLIAMGAASATLAHEIGNPLNNIFITLQATQRELSRPRVIRHHLRLKMNQIQLEIGRLCTLVDEVRQLTTPPRLHIEPFPARKLIEKILDLRSETLKQRRITVRPTFASKSYIAGDQLRLVQLFLNLLQNAIDASPDKGVIAMQAYDANPWVCIDISNTGEPIPVGLDIFEPFVTSKTHGIGLGLAIVRQIISAHQGLISYCSTAKETTFRVRLPSSKVDNRLIGPSSQESA